MARRSKPPDPSALEVQSIDMLAQVESLLRHVREIQREIVALRRQSEDRRTASLRDKISALLRDCETFCGLLRETQHALDRPATGSE